MLVEVAGAVGAAATAAEATGAKGEDEGAEVRFSCGLGDSEAEESVSLLVEPESELEEELPDELESELDPELDSELLSACKKRTLANKQS